MKRFTWVLLLTLTACARPAQHKDLKSIITTDKWLFYAYPEQQLRAKAVIGFYTIFNTDGTFKNYYNRPNAEVEVLPPNPATAENKWSFSEKDHVLMLGNARFELLKFNEDTVTIKNPDGRTQLLIKLKK